MGGNTFGSGGGSYAGASDIDKLEGIAKRELEKSAQPERRKLFLSFRHTDKNLIDLLRGQAKNDNSNLDFIDMSLQVPFDSENAAYIKQGIRARIKQCSVTIVMVTDTTHESKWVNWEIEESRKLGKGIVVIDKRSNTTVPMPSAVTAHKSDVKIVPWKQDEIMAAVDEVAETR